MALDQSKTNFYLKGGELVTPGQEYLANLHVKNGRLNILDQQKALTENIEQIDASGCYITPGLIDLQVNGTSTCNLWENPTKEEFELLCKELLAAGVTTFLPTLITAPLEKIKKNISFLQSMQADAQLPIRIAGIHLEGPFLSPERPGVHPKKCIQPLSVASLKELITPLVKLVTLAPEQKEGAAAIKFLRENNIVVSLGHSNATFEEANQAFKEGVKMITHIFNALPPLHHRKLGAVGAALLDQNVSCCVICDGLHVDPNMVELLIRIKGVDKVILVTDVASVGTNEGGLVGSSIMLVDAIKNVVKWKVATFAQAIKMATFNPAVAIHMQNELGEIKANGIADLVVWNKKDLEIKHVVAQGKLIF